MLQRWPFYLCASVLASACAESPIGVGGEVSALAQAAPRQAGWTELLDWRGIPRIDSSRTRLFTSHDRGTLPPVLLEDPGNKDYNSFQAVCGERPAVYRQEVDGNVPCEQGQSGYLLAADTGPGYVSRIALARGVTDPVDPITSVIETPADERIRIYVDDGPTPVYEGAWQAWWNGGDGPFRAPLLQRTSGNLLSYVPISYAKNVRIFLDQLSPEREAAYYYYHITTHSTGQTQAFDPQWLASAAARAELDALITASRGEGAEHWLDREVVLNGAASITVWERNQPGTIQKLRFNIQGADARQTLTDVGLRVFWEDEPEPAIDLPIAVLFGARQELASFDTWAMTCATNASATELTLTLPMPFASRARVELVQREARNHRLRVQLDGAPEVPDGSWAKLRTSFRSAQNPRQGERFLVADLEGPGKYVGTLMYMTGRPDSDYFLFGQPANFLEGDETVEVDGEVGVGTGTEESFGGGWYFSEGPFSTPFSAAIHVRNDPTFPIGEVSALRWTILHDEVQFRERFRLSYEYGPNKPATAIEYAAVGFYYQ